MSEKCCLIRSLFGYPEYRTVRYTERNIDQRLSLSPFCLDFRQQLSDICWLSELTEKYCSVSVCTTSQEEDRPLRILVTLVRRPLVRETRGAPFQI